MPPTHQRAIVISAAGGPDVLADTMQWPVPQAFGADDVLIEVMATGVNRHDINQRKAGPQHEPNPVPGLEAAGRIVACGEAVPTSRLGERVVALTDGGSYAQFVATSSELALPLPRGLDWNAGAALPEALFTTWFNFFSLMRIQPGESALIHGGTSGVGTIAIQVLKALGHTVYATGGTSQKRDAAVELGCTAAFDYNDPELGERIMTVTGKRGVDTILDMSGGAHIKTDLAVLTRGGRIAFLSAGGGKELGVPLRALMARRISLTGGFLRSTPLEEKRNIARELLARVWPLLGIAISPRIDSVYPLSQAAEAHRRLEGNSAVGKIILEVARD